MSTQSVELTVNGETVRAQVEPRMHLGDFVRRELGLTGTHLSCEHGVCGACTVLVDGQPQRSCITFAVACGGSAITTVEGYGDDAVMAALRRAFHEHHALQCGYCTPGMLCTARDIVLRLPGPDARRVRHELAGNLCRCTGYVGIVEAIDSVLTQKAAGVLPMPAPLAPAPAAAPQAQTAAGALEPWSPIEVPADGDWIEVRQSLELPLPFGEAWRTLADLPRVANCLPGAQITAHSGDRATGVMNIKFGPITARFVMRAELSLDEARRQGHMRAEGTDQRSATRVKTLLDYTVSESGAARSKVDLQLRFRLAGPLAQFSRAGLVNDYVAELTRLFGQNLGRAVASAGSAPASANPASAASASASPYGDTATASQSAATPAGPSLLRILWARLRRWLGGA